MNINVDQSIIGRSVEQYGMSTQKVVCMEECAELIQAISKNIRGFSIANRENIIEEIADVLICIEMLSLMLTIPTDKIQDMVNKKQLRNLERMKKEEEQ